MYFQIFWPLKFTIKQNFYASENQRIFMKFNQDNNFESKENHKLVQENLYNKHQLNQVS